VIVVDDGGNRDGGSRVFVVANTESYDLVMQGSYRQRLVVESSIDD
jgi:hypothetical protein